MTKTKYKVGALVTGIIYDEIIADSEEEAKEIMRDKYGDMSIDLCARCSDKVGGLSVSEDTDMYEVEEIGFVI